MKVREAIEYLLTQDPEAVLQVLGEYESGPVLDMEGDYGEEGKPVVWIEADL